MMTPKPGIFVSLHGNHTVGVGPDGELIYSKGSSRYNLGIKTQTDIENLCEYLERLKRHFPKEKRFPEP